MSLSASEQDELNQLNTEIGRPEGGGLTKAEQDELGQLNEQIGTPTQKFGQKFLKGMGAVAKGLDYAKSYTAPYVDEALGKMVGKQLVTPDEIAKSHRTDTLDMYPQGSEVLKRAGMPGGYAASNFFHSPLGLIGQDAMSAGIPALQYADPSTPEHRQPWYQMERGGHFDPNARDVAGFGYDALRDPLTYATAGGAAVGKGALRLAGIEEKALAAKLMGLLGKPAETVAQMPSKVTNFLATKRMNSGISPMIQQGEKYGKDVADTFYKYGIHGSSQGIEDKAAQVADQIGEKVGEHLQEADKLGAQVDPDKAFKPYVDFLSSLTGKPGGRGIITTGQANRILDDHLGPFMEYLQNNKTIPTEVANDWKRKAAKLPQSAYDSIKDQSLLTKLRKTLAGSLKDQIEIETDKVLSPEKAGKIKELNNDWGNLLTVRPAMEREASKAAKAGWNLDRGDAYALLTGFLGSGGDVRTGLGTWAAKRGLQELGTTRMRTTPSYFLRRAMDNKLSSSVFDTWAKEKLKNKYGNFPDPAAEPKELP